MQYQKETENKRNSFSEKKAKGLLLFKGNVNVNNYFISELEKALKNNQNYAKFSFTVGVNKDVDPKSLTQELQNKYNCKVNSNRNGQALLGLTGEFIINKNEVPDKIIELQNFCKENSSVPIEFSIMI